MTEIAPGWYPDPVDTSVQRYWDGEQWVGTPIPVDQTPPETPPVMPPTPEPAPVSQPADREPAAVPAGSTANWVPAPPTVPLPPPAGRILAPLGARFMARFVDALAVVGLNVLVNGWFVYQWWREMRPIYAETQRWVAGQLDQLPTATERAANLQWAIMLIGLGLWFAYEVPALASTGQTLGKRLFDITVVGYDGERPGWRAAFSRWSFLSIPNLLAPCLVPLQLADVLWCTWDRPLQQCLHDKWARTIVVRQEPARTPAARTAGESQTKT